jgi:hypothetical protein
VDTASALDASVFEVDVPADFAQVSLEDVRRAGPLTVRE